MSHQHWPRGPAHIMISGSIPFFTEGWRVMKHELVGWIQLRGESDMSAFVKCDQIRFDSGSGILTSDIRVEQCVLLEELC